MLRVRSQGRKRKTPLLWASMSTLACDLWQRGSGGSLSPSPGQEARLLTKAVLSGHSFTGTREPFLSKVSLHFAEIPSSEPTSELTSVLAGRSRGAHTACSGSTPRFDPSWSYRRVCDGPGPCLALCVLLFCNRLLRPEPVGRPRRLFVSP
jgi:hypothetical protein